MEEKVKKTTKKYRVKRSSVGVMLMGAHEPVLLHNGLSQKKLKELFELGYKAITLIVE
jgi:hypothetical protein